MELKKIETRRVGSGYFTVYVNGSPLSNHRYESTAIQAATNQLIDNPSADVEIRQDLTIKMSGRFDGAIEEPETEFITVQGGEFTLAGKPYLFGSTNAYYLATYESQDPAVVDRALDLFDETGCRVIRTWGFYDGPAQYEGDPTFQPEPGVYNEEGLKCLDRVIAKGKRRGLKFIIPLVNNWGHLGGLPQYMEWTGAQSRAELYGTPQFRDILGDYIKMLINRVNSETGVAYKDEPAIHSWQIGNELRGSGDPEHLRIFYQEMAQLIKSEDPNHLVGTGEEGFDDKSLGEWRSHDGAFIHPDYTSEEYSNGYVLRADVGSSYVLNTAIPEIDYGNFHWYPPVMGWGTWDEDALRAQDAWIDDHTDIAGVYGKPCILGEYGLDNAPTGEGRLEALQAMYEPLWERCEELGIPTMLWQLTADGTKAREFNGNISVGPNSRDDDAIYAGLKAYAQGL